MNTALFLTIWCGILTIGMILNLSFSAGNYSNLVHLNKEIQDGDNE